MSDRRITEIIEGEEQVIAVAEDSDGKKYVEVADREHHSFGLRDATEKAIEGALNKD